MKVKELIEYLSTCPDDAEIVLTGYEFRTDEDAALYLEDNNTVLLETPVDFFAE